MSNSKVVCLHWNRPVECRSVMSKYLHRLSRGGQRYMKIHMCVAEWSCYNIMRSISAVLNMEMVSSVVIHAEAGRTEFPQQVNSNYSVLVVTEGMTEAKYLAVLTAVVSSPAPTALEIQDPRGTWLECSSLPFHSESRLAILSLSGGPYEDTITALLASHRWQELYLNGVNSFWEVSFPVNASSLRVLDVQNCNLMGICPFEEWLPSLPNLERLSLVNTGCELSVGVTSAFNLREIEISGATWSESLQEDYSLDQVEFINELTCLRNNEVKFTIISTGAYNLRLQDMAEEVGIELS